MTMSAPELNKAIKDFEAQATGDKTVRLKALRGKKVVLYFYPKDMTPGCTNESQDFRDLHGQFERAGAVVLGVSRDSLASHDKFRAKHDLPFDLLSDPDERLCRQFDVIKPKSLYGRKFLGVERSTFLIDETGRLKQEWRKVKVKGHAAEVLDAVRQI
jgi:thioredoxin-dependent peroxiredoxin